MDSFINGGVPISATQAVPKVPFATSTGIRAPLTIDDNEFEYPASSGGRKGSFFSSFSSDDGDLEFDEFETASVSDRPSPTDPDDEILEEDNVMKEYVVSRPIVINQFDEASSVNNSEPELVGEGAVSRSIVGNQSYEDFDESGNIRKLRISIESLHYSNEELVEGNDSSEEFSECRSFAAETEEDALGVSYEMDENDSLSGLKTVDNANDLMINQSIPIALVCCSSDDDFLGDEVSSDGSISGAARVVNFNVTERFEDAPRIGVLNVEESENSADEDSAFSDNHDGVIVNSTVNEGFQELEKNSFTLNITAVENSGKTGVIEEEGQSLENANLGEALTIERSDAFENINASNIVQNPVLQDEYYIGSSLGETLTVTSESFENSHYDVETIQSLVMEDEYYSMPEVSLSSIIGKKESVLLENEEDVLKYDETLTQEDSDRSNDVVLSEKNLAVSLCYEETVENDLLTVGAEILSDSKEELETREDPLGEQIPSSSDVVTSPTMLENEELEACEDSLGEEIPAASDVVQSPTMSSKEEMEARENPPSLNAVPSPTMSEMEEMVARENSLREEIPSSSNVVLSPTMSDSKEELEAREDPLGKEISASSDSVDGTSVSTPRFSCDFGSPKHSFVLDDTHPDHPLVLASPELMANKECGDISNVEQNKKLVKLQLLIIKFLRLALRLNQPFDDTITLKILNKIFIAARKPSAQLLNFELAKQTAMFLETEGADHLDFSLNILLIGKSGVGKSATINSLFGECVTTTNPFQPSTTSVKMIKGTINGVKVQILDTPGLKSYPQERSFNQRVLLSIKKHMKKFPPDVVLYVDRLDMQYEDLNDIPLLRSVTQYLGSSIWFKTIVILTHATSNPSGSDFSYRFFVTRRSQTVQRLINHVAGCGHLIKPVQIYVSLVENVTGLVPDGSRWKEELLFLCYSLKILSEIDSVFIPKVIFDYRNFFGFKIHSLLQSNDENFGSYSDAELEYSPDNEYDQLLCSLILKLNFIKKQQINLAKADAFIDHEAGNLVYKQLFLDSQFLNRARPVLNFHIWDYNCGYNDVENEGDNLSITGRFPSSFYVQFSVGGPSIRVGVCSKKIKQVSIRIKSSDDISLVLLGLFPVAKMVFRKFFPLSSDR